MEYDLDKIDEMVLALLWLTLAGDDRAWKSHDCALDRLHARGYISDPKSKTKPVVFSEEGSAGRGNCSSSTSEGGSRLGRSGSPG